MLIGILIVAGAVLASPPASPKSPAAKRPAVKQPAAKQPVAEQPSPKQQVAKQPVAKKPSAKQPVPKQPIAKKPVVKRPSAKAAKKSTKAQFALHQIEREVIAKTNAERARRGLRPLKIDARLVTSARRHTSWMTNRGTLTHTSQPVAENIAMGQTTSSEAVRSWMNSPGHRANMLNPGYSRVGAAAYRNRRGAIYWCMQFLR